MKRTNIYRIDGMPYSPEDIYRQIPNSRFDVILGLDFGHGSTTVCKYYKKQQEEWKFEMLRCGPEDEYEVKTYISYDEDGIHVGEDAVGGNGFLQYFKSIPGQWGEMRTGEKTLRDVIVDYLIKVWQFVLSKDKQVKDSLEHGTLLIAAGIPSSAEWCTSENMEAYKCMISEVTGCRQLAIFPESVAAAMVPLFTQEGRIDRGIVIYDAGSLTTDFTYIHMGKKLICDSIELGGSDIDRAMLETALKSGQNESELTGSVGQSEALASMRRIKERFYRTHRVQKGETVWLGNNPLNITIDEPFMHEALHGNGKVQYLDPDYKDLSWADSFRKFVERTHLLIQGYPCTRVILTGGTSRVDEVLDICESVYGKEQVTRETNPTDSVARGLCLSISRIGEHAEEILQLQRDMNPFFQRENEKMTGDFASHLFSVAWLVMYDWLKREEVRKNGCTVEEMIRHCQAEISSEKIRQNIMEMLQKTLGEHYRTCQTEIIRRVNKLSACIYQGSVENPPELPDLQGGINEEMLEHIDLDWLVAELRVDTLFLAAFLETLITTLGILAVIAVPELVGVILVLWTIGTVEMDDIIRMIAKIVPRIRPGGVKKILDKMEPRDPNRMFTWMKIRAKTTDKIRNGLMQSPSFMKLFYPLVTSQLEVAIGEILFMLYEEKPEIR